MRTKLSRQGTRRLVPAREAILQSVPADWQRHLAKIRPIVFAVAVATECPAAGTFEVQAGGVHEVEAGEQVASMGEQPNSRSSTRSFMHRGANGVRPS